MGNAPPNFRVRKISPVTRARRSSDTRLPVVEIAAATTQPPTTELAYDESFKAEVETRGSRLSSDLLEQKHRLIGEVVNALAIVIFALYVTFIVVLWCLYVSKVAITGLSVTTVVLVALTGSIPTILSISLLLGLLSSRDGSSKEKDDKSQSVDSGMVAKVALEVAKILHKS